MVAMSLENVACKVCGSHHTVRDGRIKGIQRWKCKECGRKFMENDAQHGMKTPAVQVDQAIRMYFQGISLNTIRRLLQQKYNNCPSVSTVYKWVFKYSHAVQEMTKDYHPEVGEIWVVDETTLHVSGAQVWIWDVVDKKTRFLLASRVLVWRENHEAYSLIEQAINKALKIPKVVITDKLANHFKGIGYPFIVENSFDELANFHGIFQWRNNLMGDLKRIDKVIEFTSGWLIHYNYYSPQDSLAGKTPAQMTNFIPPNAQLSAAIS